MVVSNISQVKTIAMRLAEDSLQMQVIYQSSQLKIGNKVGSNQTVISSNSFIKNLKVFASLTSLEEAPLPEFNLEDSATAKLTKVLDVEWTSPRKQLNLYVANAVNPREQDWFQVGSISLLNPYGYPFRIYNLMDLFTDNLALELGENGKIAVKVQDVGYGLIYSSDTVTVHGSCIEEIFVESPDLPNIININLTGVGGNTPQPSSNLIGNDVLIDNSFLITN